MSENWGPWIEHDGSGLPVWIVGHWSQAVGEAAEGRFIHDEGLVTPEYVDHDITRCWDWTYWGRVSPRGYRYLRVLRFRVRRPKGLEVLDRILADLPVPQPAD